MQVAGEQRRLWSEIREAEDRGDQAVVEESFRLLDELDREMENYRDVYEDKRFFLTKGLNVAVESSGYMAYISGAAILGSLVAPGVGTAAGFAAGWKLNYDNEYGVMRKAGVTHQNAKDGALWVGAARALSSIKSAAEPSRGKSPRGLPAR
jgi:hypothetical protein